MSTPVTWIENLQTIILLAVAIWIPGMGVLKLTRYPQKDIFFIAPLISAAIIGGGAIMAPFIGFKWGWAAYLISVAAAWGIAQFIAFLKTFSTKQFTADIQERTLPETSPKNRGIWLGWLIAAPISTGIFLSGIGSVINPPQTWDAVFHLNALRWIEQTGNGSSLNLAGVSSYLSPAEAASGGVYPAGFHDLAYLGWVSDPTAAINLFILLIAAVIWPLSMGFMARNIWENKPFIHAATVVLSVAYTAFPERPASYGTLWPVVYAYALVPIFIGLLIQWFGRSSETAMKWTTTLTLGVGTIGVGLIHPTGVLVALIPALLLSLDLIIRYLTGNYPLKITQITILTSLWAAVVGGFWYISHSPIWSTVINWERGSVGTFKRESFGAVFDSQMPWPGYGDASPDWVLGILTLIGALIAFRYAKTRWIVLTWGIYCYLFVASAVVKVPLYFLVSPWYSDPVRLGAMVPILGAFLAALGLNSIVDLTQKLLGKKLTNPSASLRLLIPGLALLLAVAGTGGLGYAGGKDALDLNYRYRPVSILGALADQKELAFIRSLPNLVEANSLIATDPRTGGSLIYAYTGLPVLHRHLDGAGNKEQYVVARYLGEREKDWRVCNIINKRNIRYFYTDDVIYWPTNPIADYYSGFEIAKKNPVGMELVAQAGTARLYRITDCFGGE